MDHPTFFKLGNAYINLYDICGIQEQKRYTPAKKETDSEIVVYLRSGSAMGIPNITLKEFEELLSKYQYGITPRKTLNESNGD